MKALVIGKPVSHSLSPAIFSFISEKEGKDLEYKACEVDPENVHSFVKDSLSSREFIGFNVTLPLKESLLSLMDHLNPEVNSIGALNVVHFRENGLKGHNTDVIGIKKTIQKMGMELEGKDCLLWGAGGSARAVAYVLGEMKVRSVYIFNRGPRGEELAQHFSTIFPLTKFTSISSLSNLRDVTLSIMINTTPLGMQGKESGKNYFEQSKGLRFSSTALAFDLIYVPEETDFLKISQELKLHTVGGLGMLIDQALATWKIWLGSLKDEENLHQELAKFLRGILLIRHDTTPIYLCGFMGVGKTTVGKRLAQLTNRKFLDVDHEIERSVGMSIPEIFAKDGEVKFRELEKKMVEKLSSQRDVIISLGGGSLNDQETLSLVLREGRLVYLEASPEILHHRIANQNLKRPLLEGLSENEKLHKITGLLGARIERYLMAPVKILTDALSEQKICHEIISQIGGNK